eukprot:CAMPEP_0197853236 /NCGR_PEP_ID=MMETSP1438-20131217/22350_1 /TAXON_ID=1461541 /ORGANISM="Pterosperma sp., Strain CCMP1384" /LENGTH=67 /DNA_ID=CAMNT_0043467569 /DNA_START=114 /DNA_END=314 /DNA_ORIENTATION=+
MDTITSINKGSLARRVCSVHETTNEVKMRLPCHATSATDVMEPITDWIPRQLLRSSSATRSNDSDTA